MTLTAALVLVIGVFAVSEVVARRPTPSRAIGVAMALLLGLAAGALSWSLTLGGAQELPFATPIVAALGGAALLCRPVAWRNPPEVARLTETALLVGLAFLSEDLPTVAVFWLVSFVPGLRWREQRNVSRRPFALLAVVSSVPVVAAVALHYWGQAPEWTYGLAVLGAALRMGVPPASPLIMAGYDRLPLGRAAFVAAVRPSVALLLCLRGTYHEQVGLLAGPLQWWAAVAAVTAALQGVSQRDPQRGIGAMAATQAAIILFGLAAPGRVGVLGALVQWVGLGVSLVGLGLIVEAAGSRLGRRRARKVRGLMGPAPGMALLFLLFAATMSGFPGTSGFAGEDLILESAAAHPVLLPTLLLVATALNGATMLRIFAHTFLGPLTPEANGFPGLTARETFVLGGLALALLVLVVAPQLILGGDWY